MKCPHCGHDNRQAIVLETRKQDDGTLRKRGCGHCGKSFLTMEKPDATLIMRRVRPPKTSKAPGDVRVTNNDIFTVWK